MFEYGHNAAVQVVQNIVQRDVVIRALVDVGIEVERPTRGFDELLWRTSYVGRGEFDVTGFQVAGDVNGSRVTWPKFVDSTPVDVKVVGR